MSNRHKHYDLIVFASAYTGIHSYNYWGYVKEKGLERHFT